MDWVDKIVAQWERERPDLDLLPMEVIGRLSGAAALISRDRLAPFFAAHGLQMGEFDVIATLRRAGKPHRLTPTALYESLMVSSGGMTARLDRLEKAGLVERRPNPEDRRGTLVGLTKKGLALVEKLVGEHVENERRLLAGLTRGEQRDLNRLLTKLLGSLDAGKEAGG
ncbi:MarR family transcriptional regulator [Pelagibius sp. CAU 1746]|uniref:MarR family winged helix-turn-helix transcriptional regulator n=1 Tax=Pelagibius sp. CAU 1746 TaxID=3140370 RepID=UPI00325AB90D